VAETVNMSHPAEQSGEADAERALAVAAAAPALSWSASRAQTNDWLSPSWSTYTGQPVSELRGEGWTRFVHPEDLERCLGIRATSFEAQSPFTLDLRLRRHDGEYRWFVDNGAVLRGGDSAPAGFVGSAIEIHERKMLEETLADRTQALRLAERRQGQFLAMLSHELRNPLAPIANAASVLRTLEHSNPILVRLREILERQVGRLGRLVEELIDVTRAAQGQISLMREQVTVDGIVQTAVANSHDRLNAGRHRLEVDVPDERLYVRGDPGRLAQALANLIANAAKFSFEPGVVTITVRRAAKTVHISVKDTGQGIAPDFLPHAFELFAQQDQTLARSLGGMGVGLTLARRTVSETTPGSKLNLAALPIRLASACASRPGSPRTYRRSSGTSTASRCRPALSLSWLWDTAAWTTLSTVTCSRTSEIWPWAARVTSISSSTSRPSRPTWRSRISRKRTRMGLLCSRVRSTLAALAIGAKGFRSSCESIARNCP